MSAAGSHPWTARQVSDLLQKVEGISARPGWVMGLRVESRSNCSGYPDRAEGVGNMQVMEEDAALLICDVLAYVVASG